MKKILSVLLLSSSCYGALPPAWEGVREIRLILEDKQLNRYLESGDVIESISKTEKGWAIHTNHGTIEVEVQRLPQNMPGPEQFELKFNRN
jgi:hypothetical protein